MGTRKQRAPAKPETTSAMTATSATSGAMTTTAAKVEAEQHDAGDFSPWLAETRRAQRLPTIGADVPCGTCTGCCRASYFIHVRPDETAALARIPKALLFPAPGLPEGHVLMGYDRQGKCPMLVEERCTIYAHRPQTCRDFDCRVFAATGIALDEAGPQAGIAARVKQWRFELPGARDRAELSAVQAAGAFLSSQRERFAADALPANPAQLAALAIRVYDLFAQAQDAAARGERPSDAELARQVLAVVQAGTQPADDESPRRPVPAATRRAARRR
jgi:uncharacterized protein